MVSIGGFLLCSRTYLDLPLQGMIERRPFAQKMKYEICTPSPEGSLRAGVLYSLIKALQRLPDSGVFPDLGHDPLAARVPGHMPKGLGPAGYPEDTALLIVGF